MRRINFPIPQVRICRNIGSRSHMLDRGRVSQHRPRWLDIGLRFNLERALWTKIENSRPNQRQQNDGHRSDC